MASGNISSIVKLLTAVIIVVTLLLTSAQAMDQNVDECKHYRGPCSNFGFATIPVLPGDFLMVPKPWIKMLLNANTVKAHVRISGSATKPVLPGDFLMVVNVLKQLPRHLLLVVVVVD
ncbi:hypothetical protein HHK36_020404 [Tetracentron sinense]|uniref:Uncharacterized protein n=1 Tax=Tetracentron sinense TaxID=13715 RepID=A0A834YTT6_TETSI|nr:hypothetical protein HHK36_020404 [Tetracentron sinense]